MTVGSLTDTPDPVRGDTALDTRLPDRVPTPPTVTTGERRTVDRAAGRHASPVVELGITAVCVLVTVVVTVLLGARMVTGVSGEIAAGRFADAVEAFAFGTFVLLLVYGNLVYQLARWGYHRRRLDPGLSGADPLRVLDAPDAGPGLVTVLVPSYREDVPVVRQTVYSAVLQDVPERRVVICVDDPQDPADEAARAALEEMRGLPARIEAELAPAASALEEELFEADLEELAAGGPETVLRRRADALSRAYLVAAGEIRGLGDLEPTDTHTDRLFHRLVFVERAEALESEAARLHAAGEAGTASPADLDAHRARLGRLLTARITTFERKRYVNLSHEPNKAMNLNAYIDLVGGRWREERRDDGLHLVAAEEGHADLEIPESPWLLTLDADSLLCHDYARRLLTEMVDDRHGRTAVLQTPYVAVPGATIPIERTAGATTDIMHLVHEGTTWFGAGYWVGANALLRTAALADIRTEVEERGFTVPRYIHDRTVIEDTESTIDLVDRGWGVHNHPERLAYSATPPDYGSLLIQRRRWANGGLVILPKLVRSLVTRDPLRRIGEGVMRTHYLVSIAAVNVAVLALLVIPFHQTLPTALLVATCLPYFLLYARDLAAIGRRRRDLVDVYALNLLLVPVNLGGVAKSVQQGITGTRIPFGRTPKVADRTAAPAFYIWVTALLGVVWCVGAAFDVASGRTLHAVLALVNVAVLAYAIGRFIGWREFVADAFRRG